MNFKYKVFKGIEEILVDTEEFPSEIIPVVLGNTLNSQSYSLEFNRETGGKTIVVGSEENWSTRGSSLISLIISDSILDVLEKLKRKDARTVLLLGSTDESVETIVNLKDSGNLPDGVLAPYPNGSSLERLVQKSEFSKICKKLQISHPRTVVVDSGNKNEVEKDLLDLDGRDIWIKPSRRLDWNRAEISNRRKLYRAQGIQDALSILDGIFSTDFDGEIILQEDIPGPDENLLNLNTYCVSGVPVASFGGRVLLEQDGALTKGNPLAILSGGVPKEDLLKAEEMLSHLNWDGWCNFDCKIDENSGDVFFFEGNPRLGRTHYYLTAALSGSNKTALTPYFQRLRNSTVDLSGFKDGVLYSSIPLDELKKSLKSESKIQEVEKAELENRVFNPLFDPRDISPDRVKVLNSAAEWWKN